MTFEEIVFYFFAGLTVLAAVSVIVVRNPVHAALSLILCFFSSAGLWLLLQAEFLAIVLVLVYVGAVMVLFMFVGMMVDINIFALKKGFPDTSDLLCLLLCLYFFLSVQLWGRAILKLRSTLRQLNTLPNTIILMR